MNKIKLFKKYSDGTVNSVEANETEDNVQALLSAGFFLTEKEADAGRTLTAVELAPKKSAPKKAAPKKKA